MLRRRVGDVVTSVTQAKLRPRTIPAHGFTPVGAVPRTGTESDGSGGDERVALGGRDLRKIVLEVGVVPVGGVVVAPRLEGRGADGADRVDVRQDDAGGTGVEGCHLQLALGCAVLLRLVAGLRVDRLGPGDGLGHDGVEDHEQRVLLAEDGEHAPRAVNPEVRPLALERALDLLDDTATVLHVVVETDGDLRLLVGATVALDLPQGVPAGGLPGVRCHLIPSVLTDSSDCLIVKLFHAGLRGRPYHSEKSYICQYNVYPQVHRRITEIKNTLVSVLATYRGGAVRVGFGVWIIVSMDLDQFS